MPDFRRGMTAMNEAAESQKGAGNTPFPVFCRQVQWRDDREEKYVIFLNRAEDIPTVELHQFVPVGTATSKAGKPYVKYEEFISRTDPAIGESTDDLTDRLQHKANLRTVAIVAELEPTYTEVAGRKRPTGFQVKTETYNRKTEDGGVEEVEAPAIGVVVQSPNNFFGWVGSFNDSTAPIEEVPLQVIRRGKDTKTAYDFTPYLDQSVDFSNLFEYVENVAYLRGELDDIDMTADPLETAINIGNTMLNKRLEELADGERYQTLVSPIEEIEDRFGGGNKVQPKAAPARASQRTAPASKEAGRNSAKFDELRRMHEAA